MRGSRKQQSSVSLLGMLLVAALVVAPAAVIAEHVDDVSYEYGEDEEGTLKECLDGAWKNYNACLGETSSKWVQRLCDFLFETDTALCLAYYVGEVRRAAGGDEEAAN